MKSQAMILLLMTAVTHCSSGCANMAGMMPTLSPSTSVVDREETARKYRPELPANASGLLAAVRVAAFNFDQGSSARAEYEWVDANGQQQTFQWSVGVQNDTGAAMADLLESTLSATGYYLVNVRGETFDDARREHELAKDGWVTENEVEKGRMQSPDLTIKATILEWAPNVKGGGSGVASLIGRYAGGLSWENQVSRVTLQVQVVDTERQQIVVPSFPVEVEAKSTNFKAGAIGGLAGTVTAGALSSYSNTTMEEAIAVAIKSTVENVTQDLPQRYFRHTW